MNKDKKKHNCSNCSAFGKHCPHKVNGDPYYYDCAMTVEDLEKENAELKAQIEKMQNCKNCANYMISGKCPSFFRTGWCKNWEMTK